MMQGIFPDYLFIKKYFYRRDKIMRNIFTLIIASAILILPFSGVIPQEMSNITFINELADKNQATFSDGVRFFVMVTERKTLNYNESLNALKEKSIVDKDIDLDGKSPLRKGILAMMIANKLDLDDSLLFKIFRINRYAFRACAAEGIMDYNGNEYDTMTGGELIEIMTNVSEVYDRAGGNQ